MTTTGPRGADGAVDFRETLRIVQPVIMPEVKQQTAIISTLAMSIRFFIFQVAFRQMVVVNFPSLAATAPEVLD